MDKINKRKEFFSPVRNDPWGYSLMWLFSFLNAFFTVYVVLFLEKVTTSIEIGDINNFKKQIILFVAILTVWFLLNLFYRIWNFKVIRDAAIFVDTRYLKKFIQADNNKAEAIGTGRMVSIYKKGTFVWISLITDLFRGSMISFLVLVMSTVTIARNGVSFVLIVLVLYTLVSLRIFLFARKASFWRRKAKNLEIAIDRLFVRWIMSKFEIMQQGKYKKEAQKSHDINQERFWLKIREKFWQSLCYEWATFWSYIAMAIIISLVWRWVINGDYSFADFVLLSGASTIFVNQVTKAADIGKNLSDNLVHLEKLRDTFDAISQTNKLDTWNFFLYKTWNIDIVDVSYGYNNQKVFSAFNLSLLWGKKTALVWASGGGKSTLVKLIAGYLMPQQWYIAIDGQKLPSLDKDEDQISLESYYKNIGYLSQDPSVFDGTVLENLLYSVNDQNTNRDKIDRAIKSAQCEFIYELPDGLETQIGERGVRLSGWQRQRLAIAKIFLKDPKIILLDEPTSALDSFSEEMVTIAMNNLFKGRTVVIIAHRLQTVKAADDIIVLWKAEGHVWSTILERGTHHELTLKNGEYAKMLELQSWF